MSIKCNLNVATGRSKVLKALPPKIVWDLDKVDPLRNRLNSATNRNLLETMSTALSGPNGSPRELNVLLHSFNNLLVTAAKSCMKFVLRKKPPKKRKRKGRVGIIRNAPTKDYRTLQDY